MGKSLRVYLGLLNIYFWMIYKRGFVGIVSLLAANIIIFFISDIKILDIIKAFCIICVLMTYFIDYKNELLLFKIFNISIFSQRLIKLAIIIPLIVLQFILFFFIENDKVR